MKKVLLSSSAIGILGLPISSALAVTVTNVTTDTVVFESDGLENDAVNAPPSAASVGAWGTPYHLDKVIADPSPGPAHGVNYLYTTRDSGGSGGPRAILASNQTTPGDQLHLEWYAYYLAGGDANLLLDYDPSIQDNDTRIQGRIGGGVYQNYDGAFNVTGLNYIPNQWQKWELDYTVGASTYELSIDDVTAPEAIPVWHPGGLSYIDFAHSGDGTAYIDGGAPEFQWSSISSGDWNVAGNWTGPVPNAENAAANFLGAITAASTVSTDIPVIVGTIHFDNANTYTLSGSSMLSLDVSSGSASVDVAQGTHEINLPLTVASNTDLSVAGGATLKISDPVTVNAGVTVTQSGNGTVLYESTVSTGAGASIEFGNSSHLTALSMAAGSSAQLSSTADSALMVDSLSLASTASIDLTTNDLIVNGGDYATVEAKVVQGFNGGDWLGDGITSSSAANDTNFVTALGVVNNAHTGYSTFGAFTDLNGDEVLIKYTYVGDANLTGGVNLDDFNQFLFGFNPVNAAPQIWLNGDFNYTGAVNLDDFNLFLFGLANQGGTLVSPELFAALSAFVKAEQIDADLSSVPEPAGFWIAGVTASLFRRRCRSRR